MEWYFVRHGEIESNVKRIYAGWSDEELTAKGKEGMRDVAAKLLYFIRSRVGLGDGHKYINNMMS